MPDEQWAPIDAAGRYFVSTLGHMRTPRYSRGDYTGYVIGRHRHVSTAADTTERLDRLVLRAFVGPEPWERCAVVHANGNTMDCRLDNLAWDARSWVDAQGATVRAVTRGRGRPEKVPRDLISREFESGLHPHTTECPRCGFQLSREPAFLHCIGCGHYFRVHGGHLDEQHLYETATRAEAAPP
jgi:hypothetical protein